MRPKKSFQCAKQFPAHHGGVNAVSWSFQRKLVASGDVTNRVMRFASGGCDNQIIIWRKTDTPEQWERETELKDDGHTDWVRGVAWAPALSPSSDPIIASAGDQTVKLWKEMNGTWTVQQTLAFESQVWSVSFSQAGNTLAVAG